VEDQLRPVIEQVDTELQLFLRDMESLGQPRSGITKNHVFDDD